MIIAGPLDGLNGRVEDQVVWAVKQEMDYGKASDKERYTCGRAKARQSTRGARSSKGTSIVSQ